MEPNWFPDHRYSCTAITSLHVDTYKDTLQEKNAKIILGNEIGGSQLQAVTTCHGVTFQVNETGTKDIKVYKKMPKIDTLDALEEHEEHEDDYQKKFQLINQMKKLRKL